MYNENSVKNVVDQLNSIHENFIWNNKKLKVKHSALIADYKEGGCKDVDINKVQDFIFKSRGSQTSWIPTFTRGKSYQTKYFLKSLEQILFFTSILNYPNNVPCRGKFAYIL